VTGVLTPGDSYTVKVKVEGSTYSVYLNGATTPVDTFTDSTFSHGDVGLYDNQPNTVSGDGSGPPTTYSNFSLTGKAAAPRIGSFSPGSGAAGAKVKIHGTNLQLATAVTFNGTSAKFTQEYPSTEIIAIVPSGAATGRIVVTAPAGTATSKISFTVEP
jgi:hypothetical protein